jgi:hypothetical protein
MKPPDAEFWILQIVQLPHRVPVFQVVPEFLGDIVETFFACLLVSMSSYMTTTLNLAGGLRLPDGISVGDKRDCIRQSR